ncbi:hypothetical protein DW089_06245 [Acidaminococcus sp. AM05-11]|jgi:hypothetical protein|nr:hypothetical protein DW089_06245 [Acidaminococcus sp. AM05-11]
MGPVHTYTLLTARPFISSNLYAAASKQPTNSANGCLVNKAYVIAAQELSLQGENDWLAANPLGELADTSVAE